MHTIAKNDKSYFTIKYGQYVAQDIGKYNIMLNSFVTFYSDLGDQPFSTFILILVCIDKHPQVTTTL